MNGIWIEKLDAPTSRMMPVSRRRLNADDPDRVDDQQHGDEHEGR